jgi:hypothetical protein
MLILKDKKQRRRLIITIFCFWAFPAAPRPDRAFRSYVFLRVKPAKKHTASIPNAWLGAAG